MNQDSAESAIPISVRVVRRIWWFTVSNSADIRMGTDERDKALVAQRDSVTARRAISVECAVLKPD